MEPKVHSVVASAPGNVWAAAGGTTSAPQAPPPGQEEEASECSNEEEEGRKGKELQPLKEPPGRHGPRLWVGK